ncbi:Cro/CI family transcriptional regulator [Chitiniphilus shinanonensis]|uniref:Cro/CI family transcriptional regulator n=1 Tax=Chitiniphilus shinanonensis TaxID=553088 RepID=UPI00333E9396
MKTKTVIHFFGGGRGAKARIARELGISAPAVSKWPECGDVPEGSAYRLVLLFPELYQLEREATAKEA